MPNFTNKEERNKWYREYREKNKEKFRDYNRKYNREYRKEHGYKNETNSKYRYWEKHLCRCRTMYAVKKGKLIKLDCEVCGSKKSQAHHEDYSKHLEVIWLCPLCHKNKHKAVENFLSKK